MELLAGVERVLGQRPRLIVPGGDTAGDAGRAGGCRLPGARRAGVAAQGFGAGRGLAHLASSGPLIGLVSLARAENAFFTGETATEATLVRLTTEQLQIVISDGPVDRRDLTRSRSAR